MPVKSRGTCQIAAGVGYGLFYAFPFLHLKAGTRRTVRHRNGSVILTAELPFVKMVAGADKQCALYEVFQFADVARIGERAEKRHSLRSDFGNRPACLRAVFTHDVVDQQRDIFSAVTQWRKRDGDKVNSIEQVFAESFSPTIAGRLAFVAHTTLTSVWR